MLRCTPLHELGPGRHIDLRGSFLVTGNTVGSPFSNLTVTSVGFQPAGLG